MSVIHHVSVGTNDLARALAFYSQVMAHLGLRQMATNDRAADFGVGDLVFSIETPVDGNPATAGNGVHIAFAAAVVDRWTKLVSGYAEQLLAEPDPWRRIERFIEQAGLLREMYVRLGCPLAGITRDVRRNILVSPSKLKAFTPCSSGGWRRSSCRAVSDRRTGVATRAF